MNRKKRKRSIIFVLFLTLVICSYIVFNIVNILRYRAGRPDEVVYTDNVQSSIDYKGYLKPNDFIGMPYVTNDFSFISSLIEYIQTSFSYQFVGNSNVSVDYDYYIKASIVSSYASDVESTFSKPLWNKEFILLDHQKGHAPNSNIKVSQSLNIGLDYYNNLLELFRQSLNISLDSRLDVTLVMSINGKLKNNKLVSKEHYMTMSIPLGVKTFDIDISKNFTEHEVMYSKEQKAVSVSYMTAIIYIVLVIIIISIAFYFIKRIINKGRNVYETKVNNILKNYDDRIVTVSNFIRYEKLEVIDIPIFDELLTLSDDTLEPIIYWERKNGNHREAWFSIIRDKILYRYVVTYNK